MWRAHELAVKGGIRGVPAPHESAATAMHGECASGALGLLVSHTARADMSGVQHPPGWCCADPRAEGRWRTRKGERGCEDWKVTQEEEAFVWDCGKGASPGVLAVARNPKTYALRTSSRTLAMPRSACWCTDLVRNPKTYAIRTSSRTLAMPRSACWWTDLGALPDISPKALSPSVTHPERGSQCP